MVPGESNFTTYMCRPFGSVRSCTGKGKAAAAAARRTIFMAVGISWSVLRGFRQGGIDMRYASTLFAALWLVAAGCGDDSATGGSGGMAGAGGAAGSGGAAGTGGSGGTIDAPV